MTNFLQDDRFAIILRDYLGKTRSLPGVPLNEQESPWPQKAQGTIDYASIRRSLQHRYVVPWLREVHNHNADEYSLRIFDVCSEFAGLSQTDSDFTGDKVDI
jgi:hypothetical protein